MSSANALCPRCKNEVSFVKQDRVARCPECGFQYDLSEPPYPGSFRPGAERAGHPFLQFIKLMAVALLVLLGLGAVLAGIFFAGCALAFRG
jgi:hypothetical protein